MRLVKGKLRQKDKIVLVYTVDSCRGRQGLKCTTDRKTILPKRRDTHQGLATFSFEQNLISQRTQVGDSYEYTK